MDNEHLITIQLYCEHEGVETTFIEALHERGLIQITTVKEQRFVEPEYFQRIEQLARMHYDLDINLEGIEAISHMLERIEAIQEELQEMRDRLHVYEH